MHRSEQLLPLSG